MVTEIYSCKEGQELKEGKLDYSDTIVDKHQAQKDAESRCNQDSTIKKVAYYAVSDDGAFKAILTYVNPNHGATGAPGKKNKDGKLISNSALRKKKQKKGLISKIQGMFE